MLGMTLQDKDVFDYEYDDESGTIEVNMLGSIYGASIEDYPQVMSRVINILQEVPDASSVVLSESRDYEYDEEQVRMLKQISEAIRDISSQGYLSQNIRTDKCESLYQDHLPEVQRIVIDQLRKDPVGGYVQLKRKGRHLRQEMEESYPQKKRCLKYFIQDVIRPIKKRLEQCEMIDQARSDEFITGHHIGDREVYREFFHPLVRPNFMLTKFMSLPPERGEEIDRYESRNNVEVSVYDVPDQVQPVYHVNPPEFNLSEEKYQLLDAARRFLASHQPESGEFARPERMRQVFQNIGRDMIRDIAQQMDMTLSQEESEQLTSILNRYTSGLGVLELLLADPKIQDVFINSPIGDSPIFIKHQEYEECETNLIPTKEEAESWATRFRIQSGRPLDEANPVLDTDTEVPGGRARVAIIQENLSPEGLAFAFRRHRSRAWTLPLFIKRDFINPLGAGLLSFIVDGNRSVLFAGTRGAGKCVAGNTNIQLSNGNIVEIEEMVGEFKREIDDGTVNEPAVSQDTVSMSDNRQMEKGDLTDVWERENSGKVLRIETSSGREIVTTPEHPYFTYSEGLSQLRADELDEGNHIATPRSIDVDSEEQEVDLAENFDFEEKSDHYLVKGQTNSQIVKLSKQVDEETAEFLGLVIGDGSVNERKLEFHNSNKEVQQRFRALSSNLGLSQRNFKSHSTEVTQITCRVLSRLLKDVYEVPLGKKSSRIEIPSLILKSPKPVLRSFLRGYFAADSHVSKDKREIELSTKSEKMKEQLRMVLLRFNVNVFTKEKETETGTHHRIFVRGKFAERFAEKIGISHPDKENRLDNMMDREAINNTNVDVVPGAGSLIQELRQELRMNTSQFRESGSDYWGYENGKYNVGRHRYEEIVEHFEQRWRKLDDMQNRVEILEGFAEADYSERMEKIERLRKTLDVSYSTIATDVGLSEYGMRNALQNQNMSEEMLQNFDTVTDVLSSKLDEINTEFDLEVERLETLVDDGIITYKEISDRTGIPVTSVKNYTYGNIEPPEERREKITSEMTEIKKEVAEQLKRARKELEDLNYSCEVAQIMAILKEIKETLNIERDEYEGVHDQTVSTVFNGRYQPTVETLQKLADKTVEIYREVVNPESRQLIEHARERADSDIYWDKVESIKTEESEDGKVYDLTVQGKHNFVANGIIAHNTSLLSASMLELLKKERIVTVEDSVTGDSPVMYRRDGEVKYGEIEGLIDPLVEDYGREEAGRDVLRQNPEDVEVLSMNDNGELGWNNVSMFMRHDVQKPIYEIETRTGRKLKVTEDHSVFGIGEESVISEVKPTELDEGDHIVTPRELNVPSETKEWDLTGKAEELQGYFVGEMNLDEKKEELKRLADKFDYSEHTVQYWIRENIVPTKVFDQLDIEVEKKDLQYKRKRQSSRLPVKIELDETMLEFLGLWMADGCYDKRSVLVTVSNEDCRKVVRKVFERFDLPVKHHSDEHSLMANSQPLKEVMQKFGFKGDAYSKRVPEWMFSAEDKQRHAFLRGLYSGDGYATPDEAGIDLINEKLIEDIQTLLLIDGIRGRANKSGKMRSMRISDLEGLRSFKEKIGYIQEYKQEKISVENKESTHDSTDVIPLNREFAQKICEKHELNSQDYVKRGNNLGRQKLKSVVEESDKASKMLRDLSESDIFWDQVKSVEKVSDEETVYDISVPGDQNFVAGNILAHNTMELPVRQMKDLGFNLESMKSRSVITQVENELPAEEAIRTSLRLGDSALVIGEVRSDEAKTLYEAMRVGAVANFVGGTIHGESAYSVFDRVVNDLNVPRTSFKATDIIVSVNKIQSPDGLETYRRVTGITEVRKDWTEDPQEEGAFVDLMRYDSNEDELVPTDTLKNGESEILNRIAENIREWKNDWNAVWNNINLRKDVKKAIVEKAEETGDDELLEAEFVVKANQKYHIIAEKVGEEYGGQDPDRIYARWKEWLDQQV